MYVFNNYVSVLEIPLLFVDDLNNFDAGVWILQVLLVSQSSSGDSSDSSSAFWSHSTNFFVCSKNTLLPLEP